MLNNIYQGAINTNINPTNICMPTTTDTQSNSTPFSVKDILSIGDASEGYVNCNFDE